MNASFLVPSVRNDAFIAFPPGHAGTAAVLLGDRLGTAGVMGAVALGAAMVIAARSGTP